MKETTLTLSSKGQITLPKAAREKLNVAPGGRISIKFSKRPIVTIEKAPDIKDFYGKFKGFWGDKDPAAEIRRRRDNDRV